MKRGSYRFIHYFSPLSNKVYNKPKPLASQKSIKSIEENKIIQKILKSEISKFVNRDEIDLLVPFLKRQKMCSNSGFVIDNSVAEKIVKRILCGLKCENNIMEYNPGLGLITLNLIRNNISRIKILNSNNLMNLSLGNLINCYSDKVDVPSDCSTFISSVIKHRPSEGLTNVIAVLPSHSFMCGFTMESLQKNTWEKLEFVEFYILVGSHILNRLLNYDVHYPNFAAYCLFNNLFTIEVLDEYNRDAFLPPPYVVDEKMNLIKVKRALKYLKISGKDLETFLQFLKIIGRSKTNFIIPTLEKWIPGCGISLINAGISMSLQTKDLSPSQTVKVFNVLKHHEGFESFTKLCGDVYMHDDLFQESKDIND